MKLTKYTEQERFKLIMSMLCFIIFFILVGCGPTQEPDLIPEGRSGAEGPNSFCNINNDGELIVKVRNQTNIDVTIPTKTTVTFPTGSSTQITPPIPGGSSFTHTFPIPAGCFNPDCTFTIEVDSENVLDESHEDAPDNHETNNVAEGICIG